MTERDQGTAPEDNAGWIDLRLPAVRDAVLRGAGLAAQPGGPTWRCIFPVGMLVGLVLAIVLIVYKYGRA